jgi:sphingomyelin phosphodiesterase acid-like 3
MGSALMPAWRTLQCGIVLGLLLQAETALAAATAPAATATRSFVALSDIHFDPFFDPSLVADLVKTDPGQWQAIFERSAVRGVGAYGKDSNYPLLKSTLTAAAGFAPHAGLVVITGDFLGHNFQATFAQSSPHSGSAGARRFARKTMAFVTAEIRQAFPRTAVIAALGNNDSDCGDYELAPAGRFLAGLARLWRPLLHTAAGSFSRTFPIDGHFSVPHPIVPHLRVVVLNTVLFSPKYKSCGSGGDLGARELAWLERTLRDASRRGDKVWLVYHVPPGIDAFATLNATGACAENPVLLWRSEYLSSFWRILARFRGLVTASFAGHTHMDEFRLPTAGGFIHVTPAVSPLFGNNPGFAVFSYAAATGKIANFQTYELDLASSGPGTPAWALEYDFQQAFAQPAVDTASLQIVQQAIGSDPAVRDRYMTFYPVSSSQSSTDLVHWRAYWCGAQAFSPQDFVACYCPAAAAAPAGTPP